MRRPLLAFPLAWVLTLAPAAFADEALDAASAPIALGEFDEAASRLERLARDASASDTSASAYLQALTVRVALGEWDRAEALLFAFRSFHPEATDRWLGGVELLARARLEHDEAGALPVEALLRSALAVAERSPFVDRRVALTGLLAVTLERRGNPRDAEAARGELLRVARAVPWSHQALWTADARETKADALLRRARDARAQAEAIALPRYRGAGDRESVRRYLETYAEPWFLAHYDAVSEAERAYARVFDLELAPEPKRAGTTETGEPGAPLAPFGVERDVSRAPPPLAPAWAIVALAEIGTLWSDFALAFRRLPEPPRTPSLGRFGTDYSALDSPDDALAQRAKQAWTLCLTLASKYHAARASADVCAAGLTQHWAAEYALPIETPPEPVWRGAAVPRPAPVPFRE